MTSPHPGTSRAVEGQAGAWRRAAPIFALFVLLSLAANFTAIAELRFPDPDDALRLVQVRDLIAGQGWFDLVQRRIDAPNGGVPMHWSRLVDVPIAAIILLLRPLLGQPAAEMAAMILVPLVTFACALLLVARIAGRKFGGEAATFACLALALCVPVVSQMRPLRIDHHGWQIVLALGAANALMARSPRIGGWIVGLALAAWLSISVEGLPMAAAIIGVTVLRWLRGDAGKLWTVAAMQALAVGSALLFAATRGFGDVAVHCDAVGPVHIAIFAWGALSLTALSALKAPSRLVLFAGFGVVAAGALAIVAFYAPQCAGGGFAELDPIVRQYWYLGVAEGLPVWRQPLDGVLQILVPPVIGIWASVHLARAAEGSERRWWIDYAVLLGAALAIAIAVSRAGAVAGALAAVPLGWQVCRWIAAARSMERPVRRLLTYGVVALVLLPALPVTLAALAMPSEAAEEPAPIQQSSCNLAKAMPVLAALPPGEVLAPLDIGPQLLVDTPHSVVATSHHRGSSAMRILIDTFLGSPEAARETLRARGTSYVAMCPDLIETAIYAGNAPKGFAALLAQAEAPDWLEPVDLPQDVGMRAWRVADQAGRKSIAAPFMQ